MNRRMRRILGVLLLLLAGAAGYDGYRLAQARMQNRAIAGTEPISPEERRPYLAFAAAARIAESGDTLRALGLYKRLAQDAPPALRSAARYNSANLHLREAVRLREAGDAAAMTQSLPLLELAKQGYRDVLRDDPQQWDARYNLERALRLAPEADEGDDGPAPPPLNSERAVTTMKGFSLGLP
ncbi:MAG: MxaK protein [Sterolibacteriaceae bacterium]|nr:MxaK protein [Sterolibacteriaceae bacterium]